jgi:hypothetical protein
MIRRWASERVGEQKGCWVNNTKLQLETSRRLARRPRAVGLCAAAAVQQCWQKLGTRSMHCYTGGSALRLDLTQSLQAGWHPRGAASRHWHRNGSDLVHPPQLSQHGHARDATFAWLASSPPPPLASCPETRVLKKIKHHVAHGGL